MSSGILTETALVPLKEVNYRKHYVALVIHSPPHSWLWSRRNMVSWCAQNLCSYYAVTDIVFSVGPCYRLRPSTWDHLWPFCKGMRVSQNRNRSFSAVWAFFSHDTPINDLFSHDSDRDGWIQLNYEQFMTVSHFKCCNNFSFSFLLLTDRVERPLNNLWVFTNTSILYFLIMLHLTRDRLAYAAWLRFIALITWYNKCSVSWIDFDQLETGLLLHCTSMCIVYMRKRCYIKIVSSQYALTVIVGDLRNWLLRKF